MYRSGVMYSVVQLGMRGLACVSVQAAHVMQVYMHRYTHTHTHRLACVSVQAAHVLQVYIDTDTHTHTHTHTNVYTRSSTSRWMPTTYNTC